MHLWIGLYVKVIPTPTTSQKRIRFLLMLVMGVTKKPLKRLQLKWCYVKKSFEQIKQD